MTNDNRSFFEKITGSVSANETDEPRAITAGSALALNTETEEEEKTETQPDEWLEEVGDEDGQLTIDVYQTPTHIVVQAPMAGVKPDDVDVSINNDMVTIKGSREDKKETSGKDYYYRELFWGSFSRSILLPEEVDSNKAEASFKNGLLTIKLPKTNKEDTQHVKVKTKGE